MSPSRRPRRGAQPPSRKPRVAGMRTPARPSQARPSGDATPDATPASDTAEAATPDTAPAEAATPDATPADAPAPEPTPSDAAAPNAPAETPVLETTPVETSVPAETPAADEGVADPAPGVEGRDEGQPSRAPRLTPGSKSRDVGIREPTDEAEARTGTRRQAPSPRPRPEYPRDDVSAPVGDAARSDDPGMPKGAEPPAAAGGQGSEAPAAAGGQGSEAPAAAGRRPRLGYPAIAALLVLTLVLSGGAVFFKLRHSEATAATDNAALVDVAATAEVKQAMSDAAERLFSIDHNDLDKNQRAADELLVGEEARSKYATMMGDVREKAPEQKLVVTVTATRSAVVRLEGDRARVMVYVDQTYTRTGAEQPSTGGSALWFDAERRDGTWKVAAMDTYAAGQSAAPPKSEPSQQSGEPGEANGDSAGEQPADQGKQDQGGAETSDNGTTDGN